MRLFSHKKKLGHHDIFHDVRKHIVSLRPRAVQVEFSFLAFQRVYEKRRLMFLGGAIIGALFIAFGFYRMVTWADGAVLYPATCLGGWNNPQYATGNPLTTSGADPSAFTDDNSAVLPANTNADIFCSGFTGTIAQDVRPTKVTLSFFWTSKAQEASTTPQTPIIFTNVP